MKKLIALVMAALLLCCSALAEGSIPAVSANVYKTERNANPISSVIYCADPTGVVYEGRLYVYGTNDQQQADKDTTNDYDQIRSLAVFSTDDMVNWVYHGRIETGKISPNVLTLEKLCCALGVTLNDVCERAG